MKILPRTIQSALLLLIIGFLIVAGVATRNVLESNHSLSAAAFYMQGTVTPEVAENVSEIGSTDGIVLMGILIVLIVVVPVLLYRRSWSN